MCQEGGGIDANSTESPWKKRYHSQLWYNQWWGQPFRDWTKNNVQIECNSLEPATVYWKAYWNHLLIPSSYQKTVLDRKWKKLMKKSTSLSQGSVLLLRSIVLHFTLFREFGLDYSSPSLPKIKNLNSSSLFWNHHIWFYHRPNPGSYTSLRKALSFTPPSPRKKTHWHARNKNLWYLVDKRESKHSVQQLIQPILLLATSLTAVLYLSIKGVTPLPPANLPTQPTVDRGRYASSGLQSGCSLSTNTETYP